MALTFHTANQQMTFVDPTAMPPSTVSAGSLIAGHTYDVFLVLQNDSTTEALNVQVEVIHSAFGIGRPAGSAGIVQPAPVNVPPAFVAGGPPGLVLSQAA